MFGLRKTAGKKACPPFFKKLLLNKVDLESRDFVLEVYEFRLTCLFIIGNRIFIKGKAHSLEVCHRARNGVRADSDMATSARAFRFHELKRFASEDGLTTLFQGETKHKLKELRATHSLFCVLVVDAHVNEFKAEHGLDSVTGEGGAFPSSIPALPAAFCWIPSRRNSISWCVSAAIPMAPMCGWATPRT